ncbi:MAG: hypothetical protein WCM76_15190 [Bacteroidota bacterium]
MKVFDFFVLHWAFVTFISFIGGIMGGLCISKARNCEDYAKKQYYRLATILLSQMFLVFFLLFILTSVFKAITKNKVLSALDKNNITLVINNKMPDLAEQEQIISELKKVQNIETNHSGPQKRIKVEIITTDNIINLELGQDSNEKDLFWVFVNDYKVTSSNEIGLLRTSALDKY